jgi:aspartate carbamoyltransferase catalytic subunit
MLGIDAGVQRDASGALRHLLTLDGLPRDTLEDLLGTAKAIAAATGGKVKKLPILRGRTVVNLFFEPSTRTRTSFELAASRLSAEVVNFDVANSSTSKGESVLDTLRTLQAMHCDVFVVRHKENGTPHYLARHVDSGVAIINAGDGNNAHPTQGLLDAYTIRRHKGEDLSTRCVLIVGDILHSRVARSNLHALRTLGVGELRVCGPRALLPHDIDPAIRVYEDFDSALPGADVVMMLRLQKERMQEALVPSEAEYFRQYGLDARRLARARPDAIVMHPGPMNRGVEIDSAVADSSRSLIREQVEMGVAVRMAVLEALAQHLPNV